MKSKIKDILVLTIICFICGVLLYLTYNLTWRYILKTIINGIKYENPTFVLLLGLCSALAVTNKFETAYIMGICVLIVLVISNFLGFFNKKVS